MPYPKTHILLSTIHKTEATGDGRPIKTGSIVLYQTPKRHNNNNNNNSPVVEGVADDGVPAGAQHEEDEDVRQGHGHVVDVARLAHLGPAAVGHLEVLLAVRLGRSSVFLLVLG